MRARNVLRRVKLKGLSSSREIQAMLMQKRHHTVYPEPGYPALVQFVKKNKTIPAILSDLSMNDAGVKELKHAIETGNAQSPIFSDPSCRMNLLYLLQQQKIPFWQGMTAYVFLLILMQFTNRQMLHPNDRDTASQRNVTVKSFFANNQMTVEGKKYIDAVCYNFKSIGHGIDRDQLEKFIFSLPRTEQWLMMIENNSHSAEKDLLLMVCESLPLVNKTYEELYVTVPSFSVMQFLLRQLSEKPMQFYPILGTVNSDTLLRMRQLRLHPVSFYLNEVKSNHLSVHGWYVGPFTSFLHDVVHTTWGSLLSVKEYDFLFFELIEQLKIFKAETKDAALGDFIDVVIKDLSDLDFYPLPRYQQPRNRFYQYTNGSIHYSSREKEFSPYFALQTHNVAKELFYKRVQQHVSTLQCPRSLSMWQGVNDATKLNRDNTPLFKPS